MSSPQGGTQIFSYIRRLVSFLGFKILNFNFLGVFRKRNIFGGMKILWIFFGGHHNIELYFGVIFMHFSRFLRSLYRMGIFFWVAKISNIFLGCLKFLILLGDEGWMLGLSLRMKKN